MATAATSRMVNTTAQTSAGSGAGSFLPTLVQRTRNYVVGGESRWQFTVRGNSDSKATKLLASALRNPTQAQLDALNRFFREHMQGHVWAPKVLGLKFPPRTLRRSGQGPWRRWQSGASAESVSA